MTSHDQLKSEVVLVQEICRLSSQDQAELIADNFSKISNQYEEIDPDKIHLNPENDKPPPKFQAYQVYEFMRKIRTNTSTVKDDICL